MRREECDRQVGGAGQSVGDLSADFVRGGGGVGGGRKCRRTAKRRIGHGVLFHRDNTKAASQTPARLQKNDAQNIADQSIFCLAARELVAAWPARGRISIPSIGWPAASRLRSPGEQDIMDGRNSPGRRDSNSAGGFDLDRLGWEVQQMSLRPDKTPPLDSDSWSCWRPSPRLSWTLASGEDPAAPPAAGEPKPSQYAPAADLVDQAEYYIGRLSEALGRRKGF